MNPPTGTVALIFTDVEGSTALWEHVPDAMRAGLQVHDDCMRRLLAEHRGYEVKTEGDAFMVSFSDPADAARWCLAVQESLPDEPWPEALLADPRAAPIEGEDGRVLQRGLRVRMGGHLGAPDCRPDPVTGRMDYFGPVVNRSARVGGAGHGGQIVLSTALWQAASGSIESGRVVVEDMGVHGMKGLKEPEALVQVLPERYAARRFPPLKTENPRRTNLRPAEHPLVGRQEELSLLEAKLGESRLVSLLAPGGTGKTRLSRELGLRLLDGEAAPKGGVWFCDLTAALDADDVVHAVAEPLGVSLAQGHDLAEAVDTVGRALAGRGEMVLVLDNFEQVTSTAPDTVGRWLAAAPELRALATSREPLGLSGEARVPLDPLDLDAGVELFAARAAEAKPGFAVDDGNREAVRGLVEDLDGLPLALELAAARVRMLPVEKLRVRLRKSLDVLASRRQDLAARQRTLRATIDWSWELLEPYEQRALAQVSVFSGGFFLEEAEDIVDLGETEETPFVMDLLESLAEKSLLRIQDHPEYPGETWLRMLVTIREYAGEKLEASGDAAATRERHAHHFADFAVGITGKDLDRVKLRAEGVARLEASRENLEAAFEHLVECDPDAASGFALAYGPLLFLRGPAGRHKAMLDRAIDLADDDHTRALLLRDRAEMGFVWTKFEDARKDCEAALALVGEDGLLEGEIIAVRGSVRNVQGEVEQGDQDLRKAVELGEAAGDEALVARAKGGLGGIYLMMCSWENAREHLEAAVRAYRKLRNHRLEAMYLLMLGFVNWEQGDGDAALACYDKSLAYNREAGNRTGEAMTLQWIGELRLALGDLAEAREASEAAQVLAEEYHAAQVANGCRFNLAVIAMHEGDQELATRLIDEAIERAKINQDPLTEGALLFYRGVLEAGKGEVEAAEATLARAGEQVPEPFQVSQGTDLMSCAVDIARARLESEAGESAAARERLVEVRRRLALAIEPDAEDPLKVDLAAGEDRVIGNKRAVVRDLRWRLEAAETELQGGLS